MTAPRDQLGRDYLRFLHILQMVPSSSGAAVRRRQVLRIARTCARSDVGLVLLGAAAIAVLWKFLIRNQPEAFQSSAVAAWWTVLCAVAVINVCAWHRVALLVA